MAPKRKGQTNKIKSTKTPAKRVRRVVDSNQTKITEYFSPQNTRRAEVSLNEEMEPPEPVYSSDVYILDLPPELLQAVFSYLPIQQLCHQVSFVCCSWRDIISDPEFVPWRKLYYFYQQEKTHAKQKVHHYLIENNITKENEQCLISLVRCLSLKFEALYREHYQQILLCVKRHRLYDQAKYCMRIHTPELLNFSEAECGWVELVMLMMLLADGVEDVAQLVFYLQSSSCPVSQTHLSELLWALSTLLLAMTRTGFTISSRLHYNVFYVLYQMENAASPVDGAGDTQLQMTQEQQYIINHDMKPDNVVKVEALAGTGKTSMLVRFAQQRPKLRLLYVAFNKPITMSAKRRFPANVECRTIHSLAYSAVGKRYHDLKKIIHKPKLFFLSMVLPEGRRGFVNAKVISQTINTFCQSTDKNICTEHVPQEFKNTNGFIQTPTLMEKKEFVRIAKDVWSKIIKEEPPSHIAYRITPDGYLKLWQLQKPILDYDIIMIDEAQDCSPVIMDVLLSQKCAKLLVGDPHQQIYSFRGATNALLSVKHTHLYSLTQSFRFGSEIAYTGTTVLDVCKKVKRNLIGGKQDSSVCGDDPEVVDSLRSGLGKRDGKIAVLCRKNLTVFSEAARLVQENPQCKIHFIGGVPSADLRDIEEIWTLKQGYLPVTEYRLSTFRNSIIRQFKAKGYQALKHYVSESEDKELEYKLSVVEKYGRQIPDLVKQIRASAIRTSVKNADFILSTVHKSKGLEFHTVIIAEDFIKVPRTTSPLQVPLFQEVPEDEWNLLYMAVTRAKRKLFLNKTIINILKMRRHYFLKTEMKSGQPLVCCAPESRTSRVENGIVLRKAAITYIKSDEGGSAVSWECEDGGLLWCVPCSKKHLSVLAALLDVPSSS